MDPNPKSIFEAPNGLTIHQNSLDETKYVYREVFEERVYLRHGIRILPGDVIFDIGANIGIFSMFVMENFPESRVHAFEPSPPITELLLKNVTRYHPSVTVHPFGIAEESRVARFTHYPNYSIMSGFKATPANDNETLKRGIQSQLAETHLEQDEISDRALNRMVKIALGETEEYTCELRTISEVIDDLHIERVALLKIDAEGSELEALSGIRDSHWDVIRQIVMEIHDTDGTLKSRITCILESRGFTCFIEEEKRLQGSGIFNCYAIRA